MSNRTTVLITGATRGIGRAIVDRLADDYHLLIGGTQAETVDKLVAQLPSAEAFVADLSDPDATLAAATTVDHLDAIVHSAGTCQLGEISELDRDQWRRQIELNLIAVADLTRLLLPRLRESHGQVITINSGSGLHSGAGIGCYAASKFALTAFTDALREEERGVVRVTSIHPGRVDTDMQVGIQAEKGNEYQPELYLKAADVAASVALALSMDEGANIDMVSVRPAR